MTKRGAKKSPQARTARKQKQFLWFAHGFECIPWEANENGYPLPADQVPVAGNMRHFPYRDSSAMNIVQSVLHEMGLQFGGIFPNVPIRRENKQGKSSFKFPPQPERDFPLKWFKSFDLAVLATRPPLDDAPSNGDEEDDAFLPRRKIDRSYRWIESQIHAALRPFFEVCHRRNVTLGSPWGFFLKSGFENRAVPEFYINRSNADYQGLRARGPEKAVTLTESGRTCCYLYYVPAIPGVGTPLLGIFGLAGNDTLNLAITIGADQRLKKLLASLIKSKSPRLVMIEFACRPPANPLLPLEPREDYNIILDLAAKPVSDGYLDPAWLFYNIKAVRNELAVEMGGPLDALPKLHRGENPDGTPTSPSHEELLGFVAQLKNTPIRIRFKNKTYSIDYRLVDDHVPGTRTGDLYQITTLYRDEKPEFLDVPRTPVLASIARTSYDVQGDEENDDHASAPTQETTYVFDPRDKLAAAAWETRPPNRPR